MKVLLYFFGIFVVIFLISNAGFAQSEERVMLWSARNQSITNDILKDINGLGSNEKPLVYAKLGSIWWEKDRNEGLSWLNKAVDYAISPATDYKDTQEKLTVLRSLLKIAASKDINLEKKLIAKLTETTEDLSDDERKDNSEAILKTAISLVDIDAQRAFGLGIFTLHQKQPVFSFSSMILFLRLQKKNPTLADEYYRQALEVVKTKGTFDFFDTLIRLAFPDPIEAQIPPLKVVLRKNLLAVLADYIKIETQEVLEKRRADCKLTGFYGQKLISHYQTHLPEKLPVVNQAINICQISNSDANKDSSPPDKKPQTIEEYLSAADKTDDRELKKNYLLDAAHLGVDQKKYEFAIEILYRIDEDLRNKPFGVWEVVLMRAATPLIVGSIENDNLPEMYSTFKRLPDGARTLVRISVIDKLDEKKYKLLGYELLDEARKELNKFDFKPVGQDVRVLLANPTLFGNVVLFLDKFGYSNEAVEVYQESIEVLNRYTKQFSEDETEKLSSQPIDWSQYANFRDSFFETYFQRIDQNISQIEYVPIRLEVRFQWLKTSLKKQSDIEKELQKIKSASTKTNV